VVTHRPSLLALCDHQIVLEDGCADWSPSLSESRKVAT
jgi:hypothetical protein